MGLTRLDRTKLKEMLQVRVADGSLLRLIGKLLRVGGEFVGIRHRSIFGSREPGVPRDVVAMA